MEPRGIAGYDFDQKFYQISYKNIENKCYEAIVRELEASFLFIKQTTLNKKCNSKTIFICCLQDQEFLTLTINKKKMLI